MSHLPPAHRAIRRVADIWAELDYAQRRLLEIQTGISIVDRPRRRPPARWFGPTRP
jgi:hypothetical protein